MKFALPAALCLALAGLSAAPATAQFGEPFDPYTPDQYYGEHNAEGQYDEIIGPAHAFYVAGSVGTFFPYESEDPDRVGGGAFLFDFEGGEQFALAFGSDINQFRFELEAGYWEADLDQINPQGPGFADTGDIRHLSFIFNTYLDMPIAGTGFEPYLGAGVGVTYAEVDLEFVPPFTIGVTTVPDLDDEVWIFTAQIMGGLTYHLTDNVAFFGGYRLRYLADTEYDTDQSFDDTFIQSVDVGVRISF